MRLKFLGKITAHGEGDTWPPLTFELNRHCTEISRFYGYAERTTKLRKAAIIAQFGSVR